MSFYGWIHGDRGTASRGSSQGIRSVAGSYAGVVDVTVNPDETYEVRLASHPDRGGNTRRVLATGSLRDGSES